MKSIKVFLTNRLYLMVVAAVSLAIMVMGELFYDLNTVAFCAALTLLAWSMWQEYLATGTVDVSSLLTSTGEDYPAGDEGNAGAEG